MGKLFAFLRTWTAGGANKITLLRIPCMVAVIMLIFVYGHRSLAAYWLGILFLAVGMILDGLDGYWARNIAKQATREGQFLDQFIDKWGFVYPMLAVLCLAHPLPVHVLFGVGMILALDIKSCHQHYLDYVENPVFDKTLGAVPYGKYKFLLQNIVISVFVASRCPVATGLADPWWSDLARVFAWLGQQGTILAYLMLWAAIACALLSLKERKERRQRKRRPDEVPAT